MVFYGVPRGIRTPDPLIRSQILYPAELWVHIVFKSKIADLLVRNLIGGDTQIRTGE